MMVRFHETKDDGSQEVVATATLGEDGKVVLEGNENIVEMLRDVPIYVGDDRPRIKSTDEDGELWLEMCPEAFQGMMFRAELVEDEEDDNDD
jgi:hypothetical protein